LIIRERDELAPRSTNVDLQTGAVGGRLFRSPRTVESHVANLLAKTGTGSRGELRAFIERDP
jgi:DNA-binding CsgD family transcriptional regulator